MHSFSPNRVPGDIGTANSIAWPLAGDIHGATKARCYLERRVARQFLQRRRSDPTPRAPGRAFPGLFNCTRGRMKFRALLRLSLVAGLLAAPLVACGSHATGSQDATGPIEKCDAFLTAYGHCLDSLGPAQIAKERLEQTRAGLAAQAGRGAAARAALRKQCVDNLTQITTTCR